ncbi:MAG: flagellar assembly protein FliW [Nitrospirae bacterium]|nr:flagellar assembly protein FliW [Nitrospirota bacterium]
MKIDTTRFGEIEVQKDKLIEFPNGILGFPEQKRYVLLENNSDLPFGWLQAVDDKDMAFVVMDPLPFKPDYRSSIRKKEIADIDIRDESELCVLVILTIPNRDSQGITANLQGPLVINLASRKGKQVVLPDSGYTCKYPIFQESGLSSLTY